MLINYLEVTESLTVKLKSVTDAPRRIQDLHKYIGT